MEWRGFVEFCKEINNHIGNSVKGGKGNSIMTKKYFDNILCSLCDYVVQLE